MLDSVAFNVPSRNKQQRTWGGCTNREPEEGGGGGRKVMRRSMLRRHGAYGKSAPVSSSHVRTTDTRPLVCQRISKITDYGAPDSINVMVLDERHFDSIDVRHSITRRYFPAHTEAVCLVVPYESQRFFHVGWKRYCLSCLEWLFTTIHALMRSTFGKTSIFLAC